MLSICHNSPEEEDNLQCIDDIWTQSTDIDSKTWTWLYFIWGIILSFNRGVPLKVTVQDRWKTLLTGHWDLVKGDHNCFLGWLPNGGENYSNLGDYRSLSTWRLLSTGLTEVWIRTRIVPVELFLRSKNRRHDCSLCIYEEISYSVATLCRQDKILNWFLCYFVSRVLSSPPLRQERCVCSHPVIVFNSFATFAIVCCSTE